MAGTGARIFGVIFLILGFIVLAAGIAATMYGNENQKENEERGIFEDEEESDQNQAVVASGMAGMLLGGGFVILGIILIVVGQSQSNQRHQLELSKTTGSGDEPAPKGQATTSSQAQPTGQGSDSQKTGIIIGASIFAIAIALLLVFVIGGEQLGLTNPFAEDTIKYENYNGTISNAIVLPFIGPQSMESDNVIMAVPPTGTIEGEWTLLWVAQSNTQQLHFAIEVSVNNTWEMLIEDTVTSGTTLEVNEAIGDRDIRFTVTPVGDAEAVQSQEFGIMAKYRIPA